MIAFMCETVCWVLALFLFFFISVILLLLILIQALTLLSSTLEELIFLQCYIWTEISKAKTESWQKTCSSLSPKTHPDEVFSLLRSISGLSFSSSTSDLPNFPSCHTHVDCANRLLAHLKSHFFTQTLKFF